MELDHAMALFVISLAAVLLPGLSHFVKLPAVVLEILCGVVLGKSVLHLQFEGQFLPLMAELGFLLLMFNAGMEIDFTMLRKQSSRNIVLHLVLFLLTVFLAMTFSTMMGYGVFLGLVLSTTSLGLVLPSLKEGGISRDAMGQAILLAATMADFMTLFGITFFVMWHEMGVGLHFLMPLPLFLGFGLLLRLGRLWAWWHPALAARILGKTDTQELGVRFSLALLFLLVALSSMVHLEPVLGAFLGGAVLAFVFREKVVLENKLSGLSYGFFIPIFFINVGMEFDLGNVLNLESLRFTGLLLVVAVLVKVVPSLLFTAMGGSLRQSLNAGLLLSSRLSLIIAAASIGLEAGFLTTSLKDSIVLLAVLTCLLGPTAFKLTLPGAGAEKGGEGGGTGDRASR